MDKQTIEKIASLARIKLTGKEEELYSGQIKNILDYFELLKEADVQGVGLKDENNSKRTQMREDKENSLDKNFNKDILMDDAPEKSEGFVKVKKVFK